MGLYGERVGAVNVTCGSAAEAEAVLSQLKQRIVRPMYSSPPLHGARIAAGILGDAELRAAWLSELRDVADRIKQLRTSLAAELRAIGCASTSAATPGWEHVETQIGMFAFTGLSPEQVDALLSEHAIYLTRDGRLSIAGLAEKDIGYVARAIKAVMA